MKEEFMPGDSVIWTVPTNRNQLEATIQNEALPQAPIRQTEPNDPNPQSYPGINEMEQHFEIEVKATGQVLIVPISQLRRK